MNVATSFDTYFSKELAVSFIGFVRYGNHPQFKSQTLNLLHGSAGKSGCIF